MPVATPKSKHGHRYTDAQKKAVVAYLGSHTWSETIRRFRKSIPDLNDQTISRWKSSHSKVSKDSSGKSYRGREKGSCGGTPQNRRDGSGYGNRSNRR